MALSANNHELKRRRIAVTLADTRVKGKNQNAQTETGLGRLEDILSRSVRIKNLPPGTQEGLLQQVLEQYVHVKRVEIYEEIHQASVELENTSVRPSQRWLINFGLISL
jgi:squamous cell carcinoma antigen recognized by T-cells 3